MPHDVWTPMITSNHSLRNKSLRAHNKVTHVELLQRLARPVPQYAVTVINRNQQHKKQRFSVIREKKAKPKKIIMTTFGKSLFFICLPDVLRDLHASKYKDLAINQSMVAYGNRQNATAFARANNCDLLRSLKHLMETRL